MLNKLLAVIVATMALVVIGCVGCGPTLTPVVRITIPPPEQVEVVTSAVPAQPGGARLTPLYGDRLEDREHIARLLAALATAKPVDALEQELPNKRGRCLVVRYRDGTKTLIRTVEWCDQWVVGGHVCEKGFKHLPNRWFIEGTGFEGEHVESSSLQGWWDHMPDYMPLLPSVP